MGVLNVLLIISQTIAQHVCYKELGSQGTAQANEEGGKIFSPNQSIFQSLKDWFLNGENVTFDEAEGMHVGRCYVSSDEFNPENSLLGVIEHKENKNHGPAFPDRYTKKIVILEASFRMKIILITTLIRMRGRR